MLTLVGHSGGVIILAAMGHTGGTVFLPGNTDYQVNSGGTVILPTKNVDSGGTIIMPDKPANYQTEPSAVGSGLGLIIALCIVAAVAIGYVVKRKK